MGGKLGVNSKVGVGSEFHFDLKFPISNQPLQPAIPDDFTDVSILVMAKNQSLLNSLDCILKSWRTKSYCVTDNGQAIKLAKGMTFTGQPIRLVIAETNLDDSAVDINCDCTTLAQAMFEDSEIENPAFISLVKSNSPKGLETAAELPHTQRILQPIKISELRDAIARSLSPFIESLTGEDTTGAAYRGPYRILLAEDNPVNQKLAVGILSKYSHEVDVADNGRIAVEKLNQLGSDHFDLVLMDVQMPELDGIEATREIRANDVAGIATIPIIAMTAHAMASDRKRCLEAGMDDFISKPFRAIDLIETIDRLMGSRSKELAELAARNMNGNSGIDWNVAFETVGGDRKLLAELIQIFLNEKDSMIGEMRTGFERSDIESAQRVAHSLKGTLHHLGVNKVAQIAEKIERLDELQLDKAVGLCDEFEKEINQLTGELQRFTNS
jgi:CheY-like chemotaxis protein/HPt (histidine-containing phosphotransfer) domain-containing protein